MRRFYFYLTAWRERFGAPFLVISGTAAGGVGGSKFIILQFFLFYSMGVGIFDDLNGNAKQ